MTLNWPDNKRPWCPRRHCRIVDGRRLSRRRLRPALPPSRDGDKFSFALEFGRFALWWPRISSGFMEIFRESCRRCKPFQQREKSSMTLVICIPCKRTLTPVRTCMNVRSALCLFLNTFVGAFFVGTVTFVLIMSWVVPVVLYWILSLFVLKANGGVAQGATCAHLVATGWNELCTQWGKHVVARPRPNVYALCQFDATTQECTASNHMFRKALQSFPSGHSSTSVCGMLLLTLFLWRHISFRGATKQRLWWAMSTLPLWFAMSISISRIVDHYHHPSDVVAGIVLGATCAWIGHLIW